MLINDKETLQKYADVASSVSVLDVRSTILFAEQKIIKPILGATLYKNLSDDVEQNPNGLPDEEKELLDMCRRVLGPYICYYYAPKASVQLSSAGTQRTETNNAKTAYGYQEVNFRGQHLTEGETACESLIEYLETQWSGEVAWTMSEEYADYNRLFLKTGSQFSKLYTTPQPFRNYYAMRFKMIEVEIRDIKKAITPSLFSYLKEKDAEEDYEWTDKETDLLFQLKKAIAYLTVADAVPVLNVRIDDNGLTIVSDNNTVANKDQQISKAADSERISMLIDSCYSSGKRWLEEAVRFISDNATDFAAWQGNSVASAARNRQDDCNGVYGML